MTVTIGGNPSYVAEYMSMINSRSMEGYGCYGVWNFGDISSGFVTGFCEERFGSR